MYKFDQTFSGENLAGIFFYIGIVWLTNSKGFMSHIAKNVTKSHVIIKKSLITLNYGLKIDRSINQSINQKGKATFGYCKDTIGVSNKEGRFVYFISFEKNNITYHCRLCTINILHGRNEPDKTKQSDYSLKHRTAL